MLIIQSWRFGLGDYSKPYVLQLQRDQTTKVGIQLRIMLQPEEQS
jgi:hypothetical protein